MAFPNHPFLSPPAMLKPSVESKAQLLALILATAAPHPSSNPTLTPAVSSSSTQDLPSIMPQSILLSTTLSLIRWPSLRKLLIDSKSQLPQALLSLTANLSIRCPHFLSLKEYPWRLCPKTFAHPAKSLLFKPKTHLSGCFSN